MSSTPPQLIAINHDDYHAKHIGRMPDGRQFFLTTPFVARKSEYLALFLFDREGNFIEAKIDDFGPRETMDEQLYRKRAEQRLSELGDVAFGRIEIKPFAVERFGTTFGSIAHEPWVKVNHWYVQLEPGHYTCFYEPWDNGDYDT